MLGKDMVVDPALERAVRALQYDFAVMGHGLANNKKPKRSSFDIARLTTLASCIPARILRTALVHCPLWIEASSPTTPPG